LCSCGTARQPATGDPPGFRLDDCATQRNLTDKGRAEARQLGEQFRSEDVAVGKLISSQWCRCQETAALMDLGPVELSPTFNNAFSFRDRVGELTAGARAIIAAWTEPGTLVAVTQAPNCCRRAGLPRRRINSNAHSSAPLRTAGPTMGFSKSIRPWAMRQLQPRLRLIWQGAGAVIASCCRSQIFSASDRAN
jgi:hypothetical protein